MRSRPGQREISSLASKVDLPAALDAGLLNMEFAAADAATLLRATLTEERFGSIALVSSFGAESAVLLHLAAQIRRDVPILLVDTGWLFPETRAYAEDLIQLFGLTGFTTLHPDPGMLDAKDPNRLRWSYDPDGCCAIRKVEPLDFALARYDSWISGRKSFQSKSRAHLPAFENIQGQLKINPLHRWTSQHLAAYAATHALPPHPLTADGYTSIGCSPCTSRTRPGEDPRAGRWRGWDKTECGIHKPASDSDPIF